MMMMMRSFFAMMMIMRSFFAMKTMMVTIVEVFWFERGVVYEMVMLIRWRKRRHPWLL